MSRSLTVSRILRASALAVLLAGCMALPKADRAMFEEPIFASQGTLPLKAGLVTLTDARPPAQRIPLPGIEDLADRVTLELLMDLSEARVFSAIGRDTTGAEVLLQGEILAFEWKPRYKVLPYIPGLGFLASLGVPVASSTSDVELTLNVVHPRTQQVVASYTKGARHRESYWVYRFQDWSAGSDRDVDNAFRRVVEELQAAILVDRERILAAVK